MTAPEQTPTAEHIDAVAHLLAVSNGTEWDYVPGGADDADPYIRDARAILTSTDPAVHAALLDALVRAGVLTESRNDALPGWRAYNGDAWEVAP